MTTKRNLFQYVLENVPPEEFYEDIFPDISWGANGEARVLSPWTGEKTPSLSVNRETGNWYSFCQSDEGGGKDIISFYAAFHEIDNIGAAIMIYDEYIHPVITETQIKEWHKKLYKTPSVLKFIRGRRISEQVIKSMKLGWDGERIMFPIYNEFGICVNAKRYKMNTPKGSKIPKMLHYTSKEDDRSFGSPPQIYPLKVLEWDSFVVVCEGEWDALALLSLGIGAVTGTSGAKTWPRAYDHWFKSKDVIVCYDNDETGLVERQRPLRALSKVAEKLRVFDVPDDVGKDIGDMVEKLNITDSKSMLVFFEGLPIVGRNEQELDIPEGVVEEIDSLSNAIHPDHLNKTIKVPAFITGKSTIPYSVPLRVRVSCSLACENCKIGENHNGFVETDIDPANPSVLDLIEVPKSTVRNILLAKVGVSKAKCQAQIEVLKEVNIEKIQIIPELGGGSNSYTRTVAFCVGSNIQASRGYHFVGVRCRNPKNQSVTFVFREAVPVQNEIETFKMTDQMREELSIFKVDQPKAVKEKLFDIAEWQSTHITKIYGRPDLHTAIDLAYHSVLSLKFGSEVINKATLDVLVLGDTRTGKGFITEGLKTYYQAGDLASGENCTQVGLIGGCQKIDGEWMITWGMFPLNHGRLVIVDELSSLETREISQLTRIRSEGVAEIKKVVSEKTQANARIISLSNPRGRNSMKEYNTGIEAVRELIGQNEDISRFDFILAVASDEVDPKFINQLREEEKDFSKYPQQSCRDLVFWSWSRKIDQIKFSKRALMKILKFSISMGERYSPTVPIVQAENFRFKLAKISAAVAARVFSCDRTGEKLIIRAEHVDFAVGYLDEIYTKESMAYNLFTASDKENATMGNFDEIRGIFKTVGTQAKSLIDGLLNQQTITADNIEYYGCEGMGKSIIGELLKHKCLTSTEDSRKFIKNKEFTNLLRTMKNERKRKRK